MEASQRPTKRMESRCTPATARATLAFEITRYSLHKGMGKEKFIQSTPVSVGGHEWCIRYYPDGQKNVEDHISVFLELLGNGPKVRAFFDLRLVNQENGLSSTVKSCLESPVEFDTLTKRCLWGHSNFKRMSELEQSAYLQGDRLVIECDLTVIKEEPIVAETPIAVELPMPSSDLSDNFGKLLETAEEADVTFDVQGKLFPAHRIVLATRSPVFKAELYGPMRDQRTQNVIVQDMQPAVFRALLRFIYTDSLPSMDDLDGDESKEMVKHLLVAADRYAMERMKTECESILCTSLDVETVATMLALADQHHCSKLKEACVEFIMSSNRMDDVLASQGYVHLKKSCPAVLVDIFEWVTKSLKIRCTHPGLTSQ
jgi:speckle-type POZ protein|nr:BTB/POZ and MATH domain-containing protein 2-like [Lolium perenne]